MRGRLLGIHVALFVFLHMAGCVAPVAGACPVCGMESTDDIFSESQEYEVPVNSTATVEVTREGRVRWTVVNDPDLGSDESLASSATIEERLRTRLQHSHDFHGTIESLSVRVEGEDRVVVTLVVTDTVHRAPDGVVVYEGFVVGDEYDSTVVNADSLLVEGPSGALYATSEAGERMDDAVHYERDDELETDDVVVFGLDEGIAGSIQLRRALASANADRLPMAAVLSLLPLLTVTAVIGLLSGPSSTRVIDAAATDDSVGVVVLVGGTLVGGLLGWWFGLAPVAGIGTGFAFGAGLLLGATHFGARSRRLLVPLVLCGTVVGAAATGWLLGTVTGFVGSLGSLATTGPPDSIATPASLGLDFAVWSALVATPMAVGSAGGLDTRAAAAGALASGATVSLVLLGWLWPVVTPADLGGLLVKGSVLLGFVTVVAMLSYVGGYALSAHVAPDHRGGGSGGARPTGRGGADTERE